MADLIDRQALLEGLRVECDGTREKFGDDYQLIAEGLEAAIDVVEDAPTVDVPVVHGQWAVWTPPKEDPYLEHMNPSYYCSVCQKNSAFVVYGMEPIPPMLFNRLIYHYCPHCGAKMDGE